MIRSIFFLLFLFWFNFSPAQEKWAIAIHGGAGTIPKNLPDSVIQQYYSSLSAALKLGIELLSSGESAVSVVANVVAMFENDSLFNAGRGAVLTADGTVEMDAAIMDGSTLACGSVAGLSSVKNPVLLAKFVMDSTSHVFFAGNGAEQLANRAGVDRADSSWFITQKRKNQFDNWKRTVKGTVGCVVRDRYGNLAAATSTGGLTGKTPGRVGDVPVIGAGTFADNRTAAISATGKGEEFIRHTVARSVTARMEFAGMTLQQAADSVIFSVLKAGDGGLVAVSADGTIVFSFSTPGMFRASASDGIPPQVGIWESMVPAF